MKKDEFFERFMFVPVIIIVVSVFCIFFNFYTELYPKDKAYAVLEEEMDDTEEELHPAKKWSGEKIKTGEAKIDINSASEEEFRRLPGIGSMKASKIVRQREKMGKFRTLEDLMCVEGIGVKVFEGLREFICISPN